MSTTSTTTEIILVTDLVGSTERRSRVGEDAAEQLRRTHDRLLHDAVATHGGEVVKGLGDGVLARFDGAADAVAAAVDIQRAGTNAGFEIRVGISAGDVTIEDGDCFGTPVIEASRLCAAADGGQILVAQLVQLLARGRGGHAFTVVGDLDLKGLPEPVATSEVGWEPLAPDLVGDAGDDAVQPPLQPALAGDERFAYAGRVREREALEVAWKRAQEGDRRLVLLSGEPGMGKTRMAAELARAVHADGAIVLLGRADEDLAAPYRPLAEALRHLVTHGDAAVLEDHVRQHGDTLVRLVPELLRRVPETPPAPSVEDERVALFDAALDLLGRASATRPVLLVLDDLHWADHSTLLFLRHLVRSAPVMAMLVVGTYRDTDLSRDHPLAAVLADLRRESGVERVAVSGLDDGEVAELMTTAAGHELDDAALALARAIHEETGGNPFFIGEVLWHLAETGLIYERDGRWTTDRGSVISHVPDGVREVIGRRLSALAKDADKALRTAAAIGAEFDIAVLAGVLDQDEDDLADLLDEPLARRLIIEVPGAVGRFRFAHALVRQALYDELSALRRTRLHARILSVLRTVRATDATTLAHHACEAAGAGDPALAVDLAGAAAREATAQLAMEDAIAWYERALDAEEAIDEPDARRRATLLLALADVQNRAARYDHGLASAGEAAVLARSIAAPDLLATAALAYGGGAGSWVAPLDEVGPALVEEALAVCGGDAAQRVSLLLAKASWLVFRDHPARLELTAAALATARTLGDRALLFRAVHARADAVVGEPDVDDLGRLVEELAAICDDDAPLEHFEVNLHAAVLSMRRGDLAGVARATHAMAEAGARYRSPLLNMRATTMSAVLDVLAGRVDAARRKARDADAIVRTMASEGGYVVPIVLGHTIELLAGSADDVRRGWTDAQQRAGAFLGMFPSPDAYFLVMAGRPEEARDEMRAWAREVLPRLTGVYRQAAIHVLSTSWQTLDRETAARAHRECLGFAGQWLTTYPESPSGSADLHLARFARALGETDEALARYERAMESHTRAGEVVIRAHVLCGYAEALAERGRPDDRARARHLASEALQVAQGCDLRWIRERAAALL